MLRVVHRAHVLLCERQGTVTVHLHGSLNHIRGFLVNQLLVGHLVQTPALLLFLVIASALLLDCRLILIRNQQVGIHRQSTVVLLSPLFFRSGSFRHESTILLLSFFLYFLLGLDLLLNFLFDLLLLTARLPLRAKFFTPLELFIFDHVTQQA